MNQFYEAAVNETKGDLAREGVHPRARVRLAPVDLFPGIEVVEIFVHDGIAVALQVFGREVGIFDIQMIFLFPGERNAVRAEIEGSRWYLNGGPIAVQPDGAWEASLDLGGGPGVRHTIVVAPVDAATDARLRRQVSQRPGEPLAILPDAFEAGARVTVERR